MSNSAPQERVAPNLQMTVGRQTVDTQPTRLSPTFLVAVGNAPANHHLKRASATTQVIQNVNFF